MHGIRDALVCVGPPIVLLFLFTLALGGCQTVPVNKACGVIKDDLRTVKGKTAADQQRIDVHYARGKAGGCW